MPLSKYAHTDHMNFSSALVNFKQLQKDKVMQHLTKQDQEAVDEILTILNQHTKEIEKHYLDAYSSVDELILSAKEHLDVSKKLIKSSIESLKTITSKKLSDKLTQHEVFKYLKNTIISMDIHINSSSISDNREIQKNVLSHSLHAMIADGAFIPMNMKFDPFSGMELDKRVQCSQVSSDSFKQSRGHCYGAVMTWAKCIVKKEISNYLALRGHALYHQSHQSSHPSADTFFRLNLTVPFNIKVNHSLNLHRHCNDLLSHINENKIYRISLKLFKKNSFRVGHAIGLRKLTAKDSYEVFDPNYGLYVAQSRDKACQMLASILKQYNQGNYLLENIIAAPCTNNNSNRSSLTSEIEPPLLTMDKVFSCAKEIFNEANDFSDYVKTVSLFSQSFEANEYNYTKPINNTNRASQNIDEIIQSMSEKKVTALQQRKMKALTELKILLESSPASVKHQQEIIFQWAGSCATDSYQQTNLGLLATHSSPHLPGQRTAEVKLLYRLYDEIPSILAENKADESHFVNSVL